MKLSFCFILVATLIVLQVNKSEARKFGHDSSRILFRVVDEAFGELKNAIESGLDKLSNASYGLVTPATIVMPFPNGLIAGGVITLIKVTDGKKAH